MKRLLLITAIAIVSFAQSYAAANTKNAPSTPAPAPAAQTADADDDDDNDRLAKLFAANDSSQTMTPGQQEPNKKAQPDPTGNGKPAQQNPQQMKFLLAGGTSPSQPETTPGQKQAQKPEQKKTEEQKQPQLVA